MADDVPRDADGIPDLGAVKAQANMITQQAGLFRGMLICALRKLYEEEGLDRMVVTMEDVEDSMLYELAMYPHPADDTMFVVELTEMKEEGHDGGN